LKEWTTPDCRNTPSTTNIEEEEIVDAPGNDGNASMPEQIKRPNPWRKMMINICILLHLVGFLQPRITMHRTTNLKLMIISWSILLRIRNFLDKICRENQNTYFKLGKVFPKIMPLMR